MKKLYRFLFILHVFVGLGAIAGGLAAIINPEEPLGMPASVLKNSPFNDFLIPGIILFTVIGLGNCISAATGFGKWKYQSYLSNVVSWALVIWITVQVIMLNNIHPLHVIFFVIGAIEATISVFMLFEQRLFPANLVLALFNFILIKKKKG